MRKNWLPGAALMFILALVDIGSASASSPQVVFLGSDPKLVTPTPIPIGDLAGGAIDAAGNGYYADNSSGTILRMTPDGTLQTMLSGLKQPRLALDYRGDIFVADSGNNRILSLSAGSTQPAVRVQVTHPGSIAADASGNMFFLAAGALYEISGGGSPHRIGSFPNAFLLAYGPDTGENDTMYILSSQAPTTLAATSTTTYTVTKYAYHGTSGTLSEGPAFQTAETIEDFGVDAQGNLICGAMNKAAGDSRPRTYLFEISTAGEKLALTQPVAGSTIHVALDYNRVLYYADARGVFQLMKSSVDFGAASQQGGTSPPVTLTLNFSLPTGVAVASTSYIVDGMISGDFQDGFPFDANCSAGSSICSMQVSYLPQTLGITAATMSLLDADGHTLVQVQLHGEGVYPLHELFVEHESALPDPPTAGSLIDPSGISSSTSLGPIITDIALGSVFTPYSSAFSETGLNKPQTVAHYPGGNTYITQASTAGVLTTHSDQTTTRLATRLATEPNGVSVDGAGNLYISDRASVFRVGLDGVEAQLAGPATDGGYNDVESISVDPGGNIYAYFGAGGPVSKGGLLKITPAGVITAVSTSAASAAGMALDLGGGLYFSDVANHALETQRPDGTWMTLLAGLSQPRGVTALFGPLMVDQGTKQIIAPTLPPSAFDFGNVAIGTTMTKTFSVFAMGNAETDGDLYFDGMDPAFSTAGGYAVAPGDAQTVTLSFTPTYPGFHTATLYDESNDFYSEEPFIQQYTMTGVGVSPTAVAQLR